MRSWRTDLALLLRVAFFRTIGVLCPNFDSAFRLASLFVPNMITYSGYIIPRKSMRVFLYWIVSSFAAGITRFGHGTDEPAVLH